VDYLFSRDYGVRPIFAAADLDTIHRVLGPQSSSLRQIPVPALRTRLADIPHLFNALFIAAGSQRRLEQLTRDRLEAVCAFPWTFVEMRQNLDAVLAYLTHDCNISAAARALGVKPPSLHGRLARIHVIRPQPKPKR
jgi:DNA-binding NtrC family response regulator